VCMCERDKKSTYMCVCVRDKRGKCGVEGCRDREKGEKIEGDGKGDASESER
jgi:hypothetical protein